MALLHQVLEDQGAIPTEVLSTRWIWLFGHEEKSERRAAYALPVKVTLKQADCWPRGRLYPLKPEAKAGIAPVLKALLEQGHIWPCEPPCNIPSLAVKKLGTGTIDLYKAWGLQYRTYTTVPNPWASLVNLSEKLWFIDGSSFITSGARRAGHAVVSLSKTMEAGTLPPGTSAQKEPGQLCQEIHETWLTSLPTALTRIRPAPKGMLKLSPLDLMCCRSFWGPSKIIGCPDPFIGQDIHMIQGTGYNFGQVLIWCYKIQLPGCITVEWRQPHATQCMNQLHSPRLCEPLKLDLSRFWTCRYGLGEGHTRRRNKDRKL